MSYQAVSNCMEVPVCPPQAGWGTPHVFHCQNLSWTVAIRSGSTILRVEKLSPDQVRNFDANKEASKR